MNNFAPLDTIKETSTGDYDKADVERYIAELMSDFSRVKSVMQRNVDVAKAEKERIDKEREQLLNDRETLAGDREVYLNRSAELELQVQEFEEKLAEMARLQEDLGKVENEREILATKLDEIEGKNIQDAEDLKNVLEEKLEIENQNQMLQDAYEEALEKIRLLTQEKENAILSEMEAKEQLSAQGRLYDELAAELDSQSKLYDELTSELDNLKTINEELEGELDKGYNAQGTIYSNPDFVVNIDSDEQSGSTSLALSSEFDSRYGSDLMTDSGLELLRMLKGLAEGDDSDNGVKLTKSWEEETEEEIPGDTPDGPSVIKRTRKKSEVSVEYIKGQR